MRYRRTHAPGGTYFFTVVTQDRQSVLVDNIERLRLAFRREMHRRPFQVQAIVVLPDHLHTLWRLPEGDADFSTRWGAIKRFFSSGFSARRVRDSQTRKRERGIWQRRFWEHCIRDGRDWRAHLVYIHYNPVKHGYCSAPAEWRYSSFSRFVARGWYSDDWGSYGEPDGMAVRAPE